MSKFPGPIHHRSVHVVSVFNIHLLLFSKKKLSVLMQDPHPFVTFILIMCDSKICDWYRISRWNEINVKIRLNDEDWKVDSPTNQSHHAANFWKFLWNKRSMTTLIWNYSFSDSWLSKTLWLLEHSLLTAPHLFLNRTSHLKYHLYKYEQKSWFQSHLSFKESR